MTRASPLSRRRQRILAFPWMGGKFTHLNWLLPLLPRCRHYVEPYGGSASVLLNREPSPLETYNDIDGEVVNFFRVLREDAAELERRVRLTPFSREEFTAACDIGRSLRDIERARRFCVRAGQIHLGLAQKATPGHWSAQYRCSRRGMVGTVSRWLGRADAFAPIADRLLRVQIENRSALEVIEKLDLPGTLFYCDPPYVHAARSDHRVYSCEMTDADHAALALRLSQTKAMVAVSGHACPFLEKLFPAPKWHRTTERPKLCPCPRLRTTCRTEVLWTNYAPSDLLGSEGRYLFDKAV